jgi:hypothetical protein
MLRKKSKDGSEAVAPPTDNAERLLSAGKLRSGKRLAKYVAAALVALYCLFWLPYRFPPSSLNNSLSYSVGFNNAVAVLVAGLLILALTLLRWRNGTPPLEPSVGTAPVPPRLIAAIFAAYAVLTALAFLLAQHTDHFWLDWEASHFLWRLKLSEHYGLRPYVDYQFEYGPLLAYTPLLVHWFLSRFGIGLEASYYVTHFFFDAVGVWMIAWVLGRQSMRPGLRNLAFCLVSLTAFLPNMGLNGTVVRYVVPLFAIVLLDSIARRVNGLVPFAELTIASLLAVLTGCFLSPEIGLVLAAAIMTYAAFSLPALGKSLPLVLGVAIAAIVAIASLSRTYYETVLHFSGGGNNLPFTIFSPHLLFYLGSLILFIPIRLVSAAYRGPDRALFVSAASVCILMAAGALGRCDPYHVLLYGIPLFLLTMSYLANGRHFKPYAGVYAVLFLFLLPLQNLHIEHAFGDIYRALTGTWSRDPVDTRKFSRFDKLALSFGTEGYSKTLQNWLWERHKIAPEYFLGQMGLYSDEQIAERLKDIHRCRFLLMPEMYAQLWQHPEWSVDAGERFYREAMLSPFAPKTKRPALSPRSAIAFFIHDHYRVLERVGDYWVLERADSDPEIRKR